MDQCPKCGGPMDEGRVSVSEQLHYLSNRQTGMIRQPTLLSRARACLRCGYVELYLDPAVLARKLPA